MDTDSAKAPQAQIQPQVQDLARRIVDTLADRKASDIVLLDIHAMASFADYFVICTATSERQMQALVEALAQTLEPDGIRPAQVEGAPDSGWILLDYADVIVHVFSTETRAYYRLEQIWSQAPTVLRML